MARPEQRDIGMIASLVGALTGHHELSEPERRAVAEWVIDHADEVEVRDLLIDVIMAQIIDTSRFREKVAEAIREKFKNEE